MTALPPHLPTTLRIHHLGLDARDALLLESALRMRENFTGRFSFGPALPGEPVQILFVNGDNDRALANWQTLQHENTKLLGVIVSRENPRHAGIPWIRRPITVRDCAAIISILSSAILSEQPALTGNPAPVSD